MTGQMGVTKYYCVANDSERSAALLSPPRRAEAMIPSYSSPHHEGDVQPNIAGRNDDG